MLYSLHLSTCILPPLLADHRTLSNSLRSIPLPT